MAERHGQAVFPGVKGCVSCSYTVSTGVGPSVATLVVPIQPLGALPPVGTLGLTDGVAGILVRDMKVESARVVQAPGGGRAIAITLLDRRWQWKLGQVTGWYNQTDPYPDPGRLDGGEVRARFGPFVPGLERTPRELLATCLGAIGERGYDISAVPNDQRPPTDWQADSPAAAIQQLAELCGCLVVYQPLADRVVVTPPNPQVGISPNVPTTDDHPGVSVPPAPPAVDVHGGPVTAADLLPLEPVGLEADGTIQHIDDLSYRPVLGWGRHHPDAAWESVVRGRCDSVEHARQLAREWVWRAYRVSLWDREGFVGNPVRGRGLRGVDVADRPIGKPWLFYRVPGIGRIDSLREIELLPRIRTPDKDVNGQPLSEPARCHGRVYRMEKKSTDAQPNSLYGEEVRLDFSIDSQRSVVWFERPVYYYDTASLITSPRYLAPAELYLRTSFRRRSPATGAFVVPVWEWRVGGPGSRPEALRRPDLQVAYVVDRTTTGEPRDNAVDAYKLRGVRSNEPDVRRQALFAAAGFAARFVTAQHTVRTFAGLYKIEPSAAVRQVTWSVGGGMPATTTIGVNTEAAAYLPGPAERRRAVTVDDPQRREAPDRAVAAVKHERW